MKPSHRKFSDKRSSIVFLAVAVALYVTVVFDRLTEFPLYFFCDEAAGGVDARAILASGTDRFGERFPVFFRGLGDYALSLSVYLQVPFVFAFGLGELSVRLATACASLVGVGAAYALTRFAFGARPAWITISLFALSPVWFLHSRTGFEYVLATSCFLAFLLLYVLAFEGRSRLTVPAALAAAAAFYAYTPARGWVLVSIALFGIVNLRVHLRRWRETLLALICLALFLAPYLQLQSSRPEVATKRLHTLGFATLREKPLRDQLAQIAANYGEGLDPRFWYTWDGTQNSGPMERHVIPRLPQLPAWSAPLALVGLGTIVLGFRRLASRTLVAALLGSLFPASLVGFNNARAMPVGPLLLVFAAIGIGRLWSLLESHPRGQRLAEAALAALLAGEALLFRTYALEVAPHRYADYGFYGVQMGAPQVFGWIREHHGPYGRIRVSHASFNATEIFIPFYLGSGEAAAKTDVADLAFVCSPAATLEPHTLYVAPVGVLDELRRLGCPLESRVVATVPDVRGQPLFRMVTLQRGEGFEAWVQQAENRRRRLERATVERRGTRFEVEHSPLDIGAASLLFDGQTTTLARSARINPARIVVHLAASTIRRVSIGVSHTAAEEVRVRTRSDGVTRDWGKKAFAGSHGDLVTLSFEADAPVTDVEEIEIELHVTNMDENGFVHMNEITWE